MVAVEQEFLKVIKAEQPSEDFVRLLEVVVVGLEEILVVFHVALVESQILSELLAIIRRSSEGRVKLLVNLLGHYLADQC